MGSATVVASGYQQTRQIVNLAGYQARQLTGTEGSLRKPHRVRSVHDSFRNVILCFRSPFIISLRRAWFRCTRTLVDMDHSLPRLNWKRRCCVCVGHRIWRMRVVTCPKGRRVSGPHARYRRTGDKCRIMATSMMSLLGQCIGQITWREGSAERHPCTGDVPVILAHGLHGICDAWSVTRDRIMRDHVVYLER